MEILFPKNSSIENYSGKEWGSSDISEEEQRNIHKFGMNPKTNLTDERFQGRN